MTSEEAAWIAGFFEGEAYPGIVKSKGRYAVRLDVEQKFAGPLEEIQKLFGGMGRLAPIKGREAFRLSFRIDEMPDVIHTVLPYLRCKDEQYLILLQAAQSVDGRAEWFQDMQYLKASGR